MRRHDLRRQRAVCAVRWSSSPHIRRHRPSPTRQDDPKPNAAGTSRPQLRQGRVLQRVQLPSLPPAPRDRAGVHHIQGDPGTTLTFAWKRATASSSATGARSNSNADFPSPARGTLTAEVSSRVAPGVLGRRGLDQPANLRNVQLQQRRRLLGGHGLGQQHLQGTPPPGRLLPPARAQRPPGPPARPWPPRWLPRSADPARRGTCPARAAAPGPWPTHWHACSRSSSPSQPPSPLELTSRIVTRPYDTRSRPARTTSPPVRSHCRCAS